MNDESPSMWFPIILFIAAGVVLGSMLVGFSHSCPEPPAVSTELHSIRLWMQALDERLDELDRGATLTGRKCRLTHVDPRGVVR